MSKRVFISYNHKQGDWVWNKLVPCLKAGGAKTLIDKERFVAGKSLIGQMNHIQDSAEINVLVLSPDYLTSPYCLNEMNRAIEHDNKFEHGFVIPLLLSNCSMPEKILKHNPIYIDLQDDRNTEKWELLLKACEANLGMAAPDWLDAGNRIIRFLERDESVNLVVYGKPKWKELMNFIRGRSFHDLEMIDLESGITAARRGLVSEILKACGSSLMTPPEPEDLVTLSEVLRRRVKIAHIAFIHFDMVAYRKQYEVDLFAALRNLMTVERKLVLLIQSRSPFAELLPENHPLSSISNLQTVEIKGVI